MRKYIFCFLLVVLILSISVPAFAAKMFITTIRETTVPEVQDAAIEVMTRNNFTIDDVDNYKIVFTKDFGDGFWVATQHCMVKFNFLERDGDVKVTLTETEILQGLTYRARSIDPLVPYIREIRHSIDGTPLEQIVNEVSGQSSGTERAPGKNLGIRLGDRNEEGFIAIEEIESVSLAADAGLADGDVIVEVNGRSSRDFEVKALTNYLANKIAEGSSVMLIYSRDGKQDIATLKQED